MLPFTMFKVNNRVSYNEKLIIGQVTKVIMNFDTY